MPRKNYSGSTLCITHNDLRRDAEATRKTFILGPIISTHRQNDCGIYYIPRHLYISLKIQTQLIGANDHFRGILIFENSNDSY